MGGMSLKSLIVIAFGMQDWQVTAPDWARTTRVDIRATLPPGVTRAQVPQLLQTLLTERLGLAVHHETQEHQIFALVQSKSGAKLADAALDNTDRTFISGRSVLYKVDSNEADGFFSISGKDGFFVLDAERITMTKLASMLTDLRFFDDPVIDMTGLKGYWQVRLDVPKPPRPGAHDARQQTGPAATAEDPDGVRVEGFTPKVRPRSRRTSQSPSRSHRRRPPRKAADRELIMTTAQLWNNIVAYALQVGLLVALGRHRSASSQTPARRARAPVLARRSSHPRLLHATDPALASSKRSTSSSVKAITALESEETASASDDNRNRPPHRRT